MPPPDRALSAVGGGAATPGPAPGTGFAGAGAVADGEGRPVAKPLGRVKSVPITTRTAPGRNPALRWVARPPRAPARLEALVWAPAPYSTTETRTRTGPVLALPGRNPRAVSGRPGGPASPGGPEALTAPPTRWAAVADVRGGGVTGAGAALVGGAIRWRTVAWIRGRLTKLTSSPSGSLPTWSMGKV